MRPVPPVNTRPGATHITPPRLAGLIDSFENYKVPAVTFEERDRGKPDSSEEQNNKKCAARKSPSKYAGRAPVKPYSEMGMIVAMACFG